MMAFDTVLRKIQTQDIVNIRSSEPQGDMPPIMVLIWMDYDWISDHTYAFLLSAVFVSCPHHYAKLNIPRRTLYNPSPHPSGSQKHNKIEEVIKYYITISPKDIIWHMAQNNHSEQLIHWESYSCCAAMGSRTGTGILSRKKWGKTAKGHGRQIQEGWPFSS